jgi:hypothetical protein
MNLRQLKQRVTLRCELHPFAVADTAAYIASRMATAGGVASRVFSREAVTLIHERSGGIPRNISVICDNALVNGMALGRRTVDRAIVAEVCRDLCLRSSQEHSSLTPSSPLPGYGSMPQRIDARQTAIEPDERAVQAPNTPAKPSGSRRDSLGSGAREFSLRSVGRIITG